MVIKFWNQIDRLTLIKDEFWPSSDEFHLNAATTRKN